MIALFIVALLASASAREVRCRSIADSAQLCFALKYPVGQVPEGGFQELFAVSSGAVFGFPYLGAAYARRRPATSTELSGPFAEGTKFLDQSRLFGAGSLWFYRGIGLVCDRDGRAGYNDKADNTLCSEAAAGDDCVVGGYTGKDATWSFTSQNFSAGERYFTEIKHTNNLYKQKCYFKGTLANTATDPTEGTTRLREGTVKCDITVDRLAQAGAWLPAGTPWQAADLVNKCEAAKQKIALQVWTFSGAVSTNPADVSGSTTSQEIAMDVATKLQWTKTVTCKYTSGADVSSTVSADVRVVSNPFTGLDSKFTANVARVNFMFECPRTNAGGGTLDQIFWDPGTETTPELVPVTGATLRASAIVLAVVLFVAALF